MEAQSAPREKKYHGVPLPRVRPTTQVLLRCKTQGPENRSRARKLILEWAHDKWPTCITEEDFDKPSFEFARPGVSIEFLGNSDQSIWIFKVEHLDHEVARTWTTEIVVANADGIDMIGLRNYCAYSALAAPPKRSAPRVLRNLVRECHLLDAGREVAGLQAISTTRDCEELVALICAADRTLPVVVLAASEQTGKHALQPVGLMKELSGLAHVRLLDAEAANTFGLLVTGRYRVFDGGVRTFFPGFSLESDPFDHPVAIPSRIDAWESNVDGPLKGVAAFQRFLVDSIHAYSVRRVAQLESWPSFQSIKRGIGATLSQRVPNVGYEELFEELQAENEVLEKLLQDNPDAEEWRTLAESLDIENAELREQLNSERALVLVLSSELEQWRVGGGKASDTLPAEYEDIPEWIARNFSAKVRLHPRAIRALKAATYRDIELVCRAIQFLAEEYRETKTAGGKDALERREKKLEMLGLGLSPSMSEHRVGEFENQYTVNYQSGQSTRQVLDMHLTKGNSKDQHHCLRIYFFWDPQNELVVIGHLPSHLDNRLT